MRGRAKQGRRAGSLTGFATRFTDHRSPDTHEVYHLINTTKNEGYEESPTQAGNLIVVAVAGIGDISQNPTSDGSGGPGPGGGNQFFELVNSYSFAGDDPTINADV